MITITINTDNEAFSDGNRGAEVARILREIAQQYEDFDRSQFSKVRDINGNAVGTVKDGRR